MKRYRPAAAVICLSLAAVFAFTPESQSQLTADQKALIKAAAPANPRVKPKAPRKVLVFTLTRGYRHSAIPHGAEAVRVMGEKTGAYEAVVTDDASYFSSRRIRSFDAVVLMNTSGELFMPPGAERLPQKEREKAKLRDAELKESFIKFISSGKGLVGVHAATDCFYEWPEFGEMLGAYFVSHPWNEKVGVKLCDPGHKLLAAFKGKDFEISDEIYQFREPYSRDRLKILMSLDRKKTPHKGDRADDDYALAWIKEHGKGRVFYSAFGHREELFWDPVQLAFLLDGIQYALGDLEADATPSGALESVDIWMGEYRGVYTTSRRRALTATGAVVPEGAGRYRILLEGGDLKVGMRGKPEGRRLVLGQLSCDEYVTQWEVAGPYTKPGIEPEELLGEPFPPEAGKEKAKWQKLEIVDQEKPWLADLAAALGGENCVAYLRANFESARAQEARFYFGSDDGIKVWLNGEVIHTLNEMRGLEPEQDEVVARVRQGTNQIVLKISQGGGGWGACASIHAVGGGLSGLGAGKKREETWSGSLEDGELKAELSGRRPARFELKRHTRRSPTLGKAPPAGAIVLLPYGKKPPDLREWTNDTWQVMPDGSIRVGKGDLVSRREFGDCHLHVEFMIPYMPGDRGQGRGNSGVYLQNRYEVQVLDSFAHETADNECGGIYKVATPRENASLPPLEWQTYDIDFRAPRMREGGGIRSPARMTVRHNGVLIHENVVVPKPTGGGAEDIALLGPVKLQDHGNPVLYRNIWLMEEGK